MGKKKVKAQEISQHRASRYGLGTLGQCSVKAGDGPFLRNDNSLILQSKISPIFLSILQVFDCGDPLGPSINIENVFLQFVNICYGPKRYILVCPVGRKNY